MKPPIHKDGYYSLAQTAERLGTHPNTIRNWIKANKITFIMERDAYLIPVDVVERYAAARAALKGEPET